MPNLKEILQIYLRTMDDIDSEQLVESLSIIMEVFNDHIGPFAYELTQQLVKKYQDLIRASNEEDAEDGDREE